MIGMIMLVQVAAQVPTTEVSPLRQQAELLVNTDTKVKYEFIKRVIPNFGISYRTFAERSQADKDQIALRAYFLQALTKASLIHRGDPDLVAILQTLTQNNAPMGEVALKFEATYHTKFGFWPPIVPVDVEQFVRRMLDDKTIH